MQAENVGVAKPDPEAGSRDVSGKTRSWNAGETGRDRPRHLAHMGDSIGDLCK